MKLSQMFSSQTPTAETRGYEGQLHTQSVRNTAAVNRQIRSLVPGQTISGEIVGRNGSEVQLKLSEDLVLNARVDRNLNIEIGKNMTFEVKNNGSSLQLSPLFTNVATDINVLKALDMAALPVNETSVAMTEKLMEAGLPVNRNTLTQVYREVNSFPQAQISDIVDLHRLQMPVNEANLEQMAAYRNLSHQLLEGMGAVTDALQEVFREMTENGDAGSVVRLSQELFSLVLESGEEGETILEETGDEVSGENSVQGEPPKEDIPSQDGQKSTIVIAEKGLQESAPQQSPEIDGNAGKGNGAPEERPADPVGPEDGRFRNGVGQIQQEGDRTPEDAAGTSFSSKELRAAVTGELRGALEELPIPQEERQALDGTLDQFVKGQISERQFFSAVNSLTKSVEEKLPAGGRGRGVEALARAFSGPAFRELLSRQMKENWKISPGEVAGQGKVEELYRRLTRQLKGLAQALENAGQTDSAAYRATANLSGNVDFLQQVNQMYPYVQLPLKLQQGEAHGDLYVYTNKRHLARQDGTVSALLHLDMEHLGPVDVYVTLQNSRVNTNFKVRDDEMLDFLMGHMDLLTERLKKRGYDCSFSMSTYQEAEDGGPKSGIEPILRQETGVSLAHYAFDVRT